MRTAFRPLVSAIRDGNLDLFKNTIKPNGVLDTALSERDLTQLLHFVIDQQGLTEKIRLSFVKYFFEEEMIDSVDIIVSDKTALLIAVEHNLASIVEFLLDNGANVDCILPHETTALFMAVRKNHAPMVELLLDQGVSVEGSELEWDSTPLMQAAELGCRAIVELLLDKGARIDRAVDERGTALLVAAAHGKQEVVELLIDRKAKTDYTASDGATVLSEAVESGIWI